MGYTLGLTICQDTEFSEELKSSLFAWVKKTNRKLSRRSERIWLSPLDEDFGFRALLKPGYD